jgi:hypothetical protein
MTVERRSGPAEHHTEVSVANVGTTLTALNIWLDQTKKLFAGPIDIACFSLGTVIIAFAIWGRLFDPRTWAAPEFLGLLSLAAIMFLVACAERVLVNRTHQNSDAILKLIRAEIENISRVTPPDSPDPKKNRRFSFSTKGNAGS